VKLQTCNSGAVHTLTITTPFGTAVQARLLVVNKIIRQNFANCIVSHVISFFFNAVCMSVKIYLVTNFLGSFLCVLTTCTIYATEKLNTIIMINGFTRVQKEAILVFKLVLWDVKPCNFVSMYQHFGKTRWWREKVPPKPCYMGTN